MGGYAWARLWALPPEDQGCLLHREEPPWRPVSPLAGQGAAAQRAGRQEPSTGLSRGRAMQSAQASVGIPACRAVCGSECVGADFLEGETPTGPQRTGPGCEEALTHKDAGTGNPEVCSPSGSRPCLERSGFPPRQGSGGQRAQERLGTAALPLRAKRQWAAPLCVHFRHEHRRTGKHGGKAVCRTGLARRSPDDAQTDREPS